MSRIEEILAVFDDDCDPFNQGISGDARDAIVSELAQLSQGIADPWLQFRAVGRLVAEQPADARWTTLAESLIARMPADHPPLEIAQHIVGTLFQWWDQNADQDRAFETLIRIVEDRIVQTKPDEAQSTAMLLEILNDEGMRRYMPRIGKWLAKQAGVIWVFERLLSRIPVLFWGSSEESDTFPEEARILVPCLDAGCAESLLDLLLTATRTNGWYTSGDEELFRLFLLACPPERCIEQFSESLAALREKHEPRSRRALEPDVHTDLVRAAARVMPAKSIEDVVVGLFTNHLSEPTESARSAIIQLVYDHAMNMSAASLWSLWVTALSSQVKLPDRNCIHHVNAIRISASRRPQEMEAILMPQLETTDGELWTAAAILASEMGPKFSGRSRWPLVRAALGKIDSGISRQREAAIGIVRAMAGTIEPDLVPTAIKRIADAGHAADVDRRLVWILASRLSADDAVALAQALFETGRLESDDLKRASYQSVFEAVSWQLTSAAMVFPCMEFAAGISSSKTAVDVEWMTQLVSRLTTADRETTLTRLADCLKSSVDEKSVSWSEWFRESARLLNHPVSETGPNSPSSPARPIEISAAAASVWLHLEEIDSLGFDAAHQAAIECRSVTLRDARPILDAALAQYSRQTDPAARSSLRTVVYAMAQLIGGKDRAQAIAAVEPMPRAKR
jgi:hypothetical protein